MRCERTITLSLERTAFHLSELVRHDENNIVAPYICLIDWDYEPIEPRLCLLGPEGRFTVFVVETQICIE